MSAHVLMMARADILCAVLPPGFLLLLRAELTDAVASPLPPYAPAMRTPVLTYALCDYQVFGHTAQVTCNDG